MKREIRSCLFSLSVACWLAALIAAAEAEQALSFTHHSLSPGSNGALLVGAGDFDDDGDTDTVSSIGGTPAWFESNGAPQPTFTRHLITGGKAVNGPGGVADFDGDGRLDFAARSSSDIVWYRNRGGTPLAFSCDDIATSVGHAIDLWVTDLNGDGHPDLLACLWGPDALLWYENSGGANPAFTSHTIALNTPMPRRLAAADLDGDGDLDVLVCFEIEPKPAWFESDGGAVPAFTSHTIPISRPPAALATADLNDDGRLDIAIASSGLNWLVNSGASPLTFTAGEIDITGAGEMQEDADAADLDLDGDVDIVSCTSIFGSAALDWYENTSTSTTVQMKYHTGNYSSGAPRIVITDLDGDGDPDIVTSNHEWWENSLISPPEPTEVAPFGLDGYGAHSLLLSPPYLYAGTHKGVHRRDLSRPEDGWTTLGLANLSIRSLAVDPRSSVTLYAGLGVGANLAQAASLYRSTDGGATWGEAGEGIGTGKTISKIEAAAPTSGTLLYALSANDSKLYRSADGARSWQNIGAFPLTQDIAIAPSQPNVIYLLLRSMGMMDSACLKSEDGGTTWTFVNESLQEISACMAADPQNPDILYVGGYGLQKSIDGGRSFQTGPPPEDQLAAIAVHPREPEQIFFAGPDWEYFRLYESRDGGSHWRLVEQNQERPGINCIAPDPDNPRVAYLGTENGVWRVQTPEQWPIQARCEAPWSLYE